MQAVPGSQPHGTGRSATDARGPDRAPSRATIARQTRQAHLLRDAWPLRRWLSASAPARFSALPPFRLLTDPLSQALRRVIFPYPSPSRTLASTLLSENAAGR